MAPSQAAPGFPAEGRAPRQVFATGVRPLERAAGEDQEGEAVRRQASEGEAPAA